MLLLVTSSAELQTAVSIPNGITARPHVIVEASVHPCVTPSLPLAIQKFTNKNQFELVRM